jgi:hypothetical protein
MDLLRRAFTEHPVATTIVTGLELAAFVVVVSVVAGHLVISPFSIVAIPLTALGVWAWRKYRE